MKKLPFVTIGIPFYNAEKFLEYAIKSVLAQTYQNWELILVNDGSSDNSVNIAEKYEKIDCRIRLIDDGENKKLPFRLNQIIDEARYDYIVRMDADDIMHIERLKIQLEFLEKNLEYDLVSTSMYSIDTYNNIVGQRIIGDNVSLKTLLQGNNQIVHPSVFARKKWYLRNRYDIGSERAEDYELWLRACFNNDLKIKVISIPLLFYREFGNLNKGNLILSYKTTNQIFNKYKYKIPFFSMFKAKINLYIKMAIVSFIFFIGKEDFLVFKRNNTLLDIDLINAKRQLYQVVQVDE